MISNTQRCHHCHVPIGRSAAQVCIVCAFCVDVPPAVQDEAADAIDEPKARAYVRARARAHRQRAAAFGGAD